MMFMNNNQYLIIGVRFIIGRFDLDNFKQPQLVGFTQKDKKFIQHFDGQHIIFINEEGQISFSTTHSIHNISGTHILDKAEQYFIYFSKKEKSTNIIEIFSQYGNKLYFQKINAKTSLQLIVKVKVYDILQTNTVDLWIFRGEKKNKPQFIIFDLKKNTTNTIEDKDQKLKDFQLSEDDQYLVSAYEDSHIKVWNMKTYKLLFKQKMDTDSLDRVLISTKGMLVGCYKNKLKIWNFKALRQQQNFEMDGHIDSLQNILVSPDGLVLFSESQPSDSQVLYSGIKFWDLEQLQLLNELDNDYVVDCKFDNNGIVKLKIQIVSLCNYSIIQCYQLNLISVPICQMLPKQSNRNLINIHTCFSKIKQISSINLTNNRFGKQIIQKPKKFSEQIFDFHYISQFILLYKNSNRISLKFFYNKIIKFYKRNQKNVKLNWLAKNKNATCQGKQNKHSLIIIALGQHSRKEVEEQRNRVEQELSKTKKELKYQKSLTDRRSAKLNTRINLYCRASSFQMNCQQSQMNKTIYIIIMFFQLMKNYI